MTAASMHHITVVLCSVEYSSGFFFRVASEYRYSIKTGIDNMSRALYWKAWTKSRWSSECIALCEPHPGHLSPVSIRNGHLGKTALPDGSIEK